MCVVWNNTHRFNSNRKIRWSPGCLELSQTIHPSISASDLLSFSTHRCSFIKHRGSVTEQTYSLCDSCLQISRCGCHHELTPSKASSVIQGEEVSGPAQLLPGNGLQQRITHAWGWAWVDLAVDNPTKYTKGWSRGPCSFLALRGLWSRRVTPGLCSVLNLCGFVGFGFSSLSGRLLSLAQELLFKGIYKANIFCLPCSGNKGNANY